MKKRALVSVSDKTGLVEFVKGLVDLGWEIIATGGTQKLLEQSGIHTTGISEVTGFPCPPRAPGAYGNSSRERD